MKKILIVEDEEPVRQVLGEFMEYAGFGFTALEDGTNANATLRREDYNVLLTDINMPGKNGIDIIKEARADNPDLIIIALTGGLRSSLSSSDFEAIMAGADKCLFKPFSGIAVIEVINKLIEDHKIEIKKAS